MYITPTTILAFVMADFRYTVSLSPVLGYTFLLFIPSCLYAEPEKRYKTAMF
jgi:hypothetical protein